MHCNVDFFSIRVEACFLSLGDASPTKDMTPIHHNQQRLGALQDACFYIKVQVGFFSSTAPTSCYYCVHEANHIYILL
jgi:hypothetical protein